MKRNLHIFLTATTSSFVMFLALVQDTTTPIAVRPVYPRDHEIPSRTYTPSGTEPFPVVHQFKSPSDAQDLRIDLLHSDLRGLPPTTIITAQIDPLRSGSEMLADQLKGAGVKLDPKNYDGVPIEFFGMGMAIKESRHGKQFAGTNLMKAFKNSPAPNV